MLSTFASITPHLKFKSKIISIDNVMFKFHYRATFLMLLVCTILVTSRQYIGEHIACVTGNQRIPVHVMNTFCFFTSTFTVVRHYNETQLRHGNIPHPGVGPAYYGDNLKHHAYYQWVPFVLFGQALAFYLPHLLWRSWEGGKIRSLVDGMQRIALSEHLTNDEELDIGGRKFPSQTTTDSRLGHIKIAFLKHLSLNHRWAMQLVTCELLNLINLAVQIYATDKFLAGQFIPLGHNFIEDDFRGIMDPLDVVFPKVTKCTFHKYGPSGSIETHDALCVMALNVINEKIFVLLWFWYIVLAVVTGLSLLWRFITWLFHSRSLRFNGFVFSIACPRRLKAANLQIVMDELCFGEWLFLYYLAKNLEPYLFRKLLGDLSMALHKRKEAQLAEVDALISEGVQYDYDDPEKGQLPLTDFAKYQKSV